MAAFDYNDMLARAQRDTRTSGSADFPAATDWQAWFTDGENFIKGIVAYYCPRAEISAPTLMTTSDGGITFTFGSDSAGNAIEPFGNVTLYRRTGDIPDFPMELGVDYLDEGTKIRMPTNVAMAASFPDGAPYFQGIVPTVAIDGSTAPTLIPADKRVITVAYACARYAKAGGAFDPSPYEEQGLNGEQWPRGLSSWILQLQHKYARAGVLASTRSTPVLSPRLRRIANTRVWPYGR